MSHHSAPGVNVYDAGAGLPARQETHTLHLAETMQQHAVYHFVVDGDATYHGNNVRDRLVDLGRYTLIDGTLWGSEGEWTIDGGVVEAFVDGSGVRVTFDGQPVSAQGIVDMTGGTHPSRLDPPPQCEVDTDCTGDLVCDGETCVAPEGFCDDECDCPRPPSGGSRSVGVEKAALAVAGGLAAGAFIL